MAEENMRGLFSALTTETEEAGMELMSTLLLQRAAPSSLIH